MGYRTFLDLDNEYLMLDANKQFYNDLRLQGMHSFASQGNTKFMQAYFQAVKIDCDCCGHADNFADVCTSGAYERETILNQLTEHFKITFLSPTKLEELLGYK